MRLIRSGERAVLEDGTRLVVTDLTVPPFSWMKYIVISRIDMEESGAEILAHEQAHIRACHSLDMWFAGCCAVLHWFNPAVWLLKQELQNVHEYEADESVIAHGVVKASAQKEVFEKIEPFLTGEEMAVYKRGRHSKSGSVAKNASMMDYRKATGVEALVGYLYLAGDMDRIIELIGIGFDLNKKEEIGEEHES